jgi:hypothetical protein
VSALSSLGALDEYDQHRQPPLLLPSNLPHAIPVLTSAVA